MVGHAVALLTVVFTVRAEFGCAEELFPVDRERWSLQSGQLKVVLILAVLYFNF